MSRLELDVRLQRDAFTLSVTENLVLDGITSLFGANGSGKTTLLRTIAGLESGATGRIQFRDKPWMEGPTRVSAENRAIGYVFQDGRLFAHLTVRDNLLFPLKRGGRSGPIDWQDVAAGFDLEALLDRYPENLSGGERQRVAIARALASNPELLLMDEPLSALDIARKQELLPLITSLPERYDIPVLLVTHDVDELITLTNDVLLLAEGRVAARGTAREILERSDIAQLAGIEDPGSVIEATASEHREGMTTLTLPTGQLRIPQINCNPGDNVRLRINPRDVIIALEPVTGLSIRNSLPARVTSVGTRDNNQAVVSLALGDQTLKALITHEAARELELASGSEVFALIKTVALDSLNSHS